MSNNKEISISQNITHSLMMCNKSRFPSSSESNQKTSTDFEQVEAGIVKLNNNNNKIFWAKFSADLGPNWQKDLGVECGVIWNPSLQTFCPMYAWNF